MLSSLCPGGVQDPSSELPVVGSGWGMGEWGILHHLGQGVPTGEQPFNGASWLWVGCHLQRTLYILFPFHYKMYDA